MRRLGLMFAFLLIPLSAEATTYYLSPTGSNSNTETQAQNPATPWLTFSFALANGAGCDDTLVLLNGTYGDGTSTGKPDIVSLVCTAGHEFTLKALNSRQARINDDGTGYAIRVRTSAYLIFDGLVRNSTDNNYITTSTAELGIPMHVSNSNNITVKNGLCRNPNRYGNNSCTFFVTVTNGVVQDEEVYNFHRHGVVTIPGTSVRVTRLYCNPRTGGLAPPGYPNGNGTNGADACFAYYPCNNCIGENIIADGTGGKTLELAEMNASGQVALSGNKLLGSIGLNTWSGACVKIGARGATLQLMPQSNTVTNVVCKGGVGTGIYSRGGKNTQVNNSSVISTTNSGFLADVEGTFTGDGNRSFFSTNSLAVNTGSRGFYIDTAVTQTWTITKPDAFGNVTNYLPANGTNYNPNPPTSIDPALGTCVAWLPDTSPLKGAGSGGVDIGATILYRYENGVLTTTPLWDQTTGAWPFGATVAGINDVAGASAFDVHKRANINFNGCAFPASFGAADTTAPSVPASVLAVSTTATQITVSWTASTDNVGVTGYRVERCQGSGCSNFVEVGTPTVSPFADPGLTNSVLYRYRVRAVDPSNNLSNYSSIAQVTTVPDITAPAPPSGITVTPVPGRPAQ